MMGMWERFSLASSSQAALSWPLPPSMRMRFGSLEKESSSDLGSGAADCGLGAADWFWTGLTRLTGLEISDSGPSGTETADEASAWTGEAPVLPSTKRL